MSGNITRHRSCCGLLYASHFKRTCGIIYAIVVAPYGTGTRRSIGTVTSTRRPFQQNITASGPVTTAGRKTERSFAKILLPSFEIQQVSMLQVAVVVALALALASARVPYGGVDPLENLYLQRLYQMSNYQNDPYLPLLPIDDIDGRSDEAMDEARAFWGEEGGDDEADVGDSIYNSPLFTGAQARDEEHLEHSALQGLHQVSGGTLEGQPPQKQVKTDKPLPAYCNPPNPCPLGKTDADNCVENFENSMENNKRLLEAQDCPCDTEHMFSCPAGQQTVTSKGAGGQAALNKVMNELAQLHSAQDLSLDTNPYLTSGLKREKLVAKKSPGLMRHKRTMEKVDWNPYLEGQQLDVAAKKSPMSDYPPY